MKDYKNIIFEMVDHVAILCLNNPESRNPLTDETKEEMLSALEEVEKKDECRAMIITGRGTAFCAGGDIKRIAQELSPEEIREIMEKSQRLLLRMINLEKPVVAAINGDAFGMGCNLILTTDFPIASEKARFSEAFIRLGVVPDFGALYFLPRMIGIWKTKELVYLGSVIGAEEALKIGLIYKIVPHDELDKEAMTLARRLSEMPTKAIGRAKKILAKSFEMSLSDILEEEVISQTFLSKTEDHREAIRAFFEKRQPIFKGK